MSCALEQGKKGPVSPHAATTHARHVSSPYPAPIARHQGDLTGETFEQKMRQFLPNP